MWVVVNIRVPFWVLYNYYTAPNIYGTQKVDNHPCRLLFWRVYVNP